MNEDDRIGRALAAAQARWDGHEKADIKPPSAVPYAHRGKRRRRYTGEMIRCLHAGEYHGQYLSCGALLWKADLDGLREHLATAHKIIFSGDDTQTITDQVLQAYEDARQTDEGRKLDERHGDY